MDGMSRPGGGEKGGGSRGETVTGALEGGGGSSSVLSGFRGDTLVKSNPRDLTDLELATRWITCGGPEGLRQVHPVVG